jgi:uncharacterized repeat protein (TIGR01451 family)
MRSSLFCAIMVYCLSSTLGSMTGFSPVHKSFAREVTGRSMYLLHHYHHKHDQVTPSLFHTHGTTAPDAQIAMTDAGGGTYQVGDNVTYSLDITISADGGEVPDQTPLTVTDQIPAGFENLTASGTDTDWNLSLDTTTSPATLTATYTGATPIPPGTMLSSIILAGTLTNQAAASLTNTATLALAGDSNSTNDTASVVIQVTPSSTPTPEPTLTSSPTPEASPTPTAGPDLAVSLGNDTTRCSNIGDQITYTATVTNAMNADVVGTGQPITLTISLPDGLSGVTPDGGTDWQTTTNGTTVLASYSGSYPIAAGASPAPVTITATMQTPSNMSPVSSATVTTPQDTNNSNDIGNDTLTICAPNLAMSTIHLDTGTSQVGQTVTYTLSVSDGMAGGPVIAGQPITVTDAVPLSINQVTSTGTGWQFTTNPTLTATMITATYTGDYPILTGDSLPDITLNGVLTGAAVPTVTNSAKVSTPLDTDPSDNVSSDTLNVAPAPDLIAGLQHAGNTCIPVRQDVIWTLSVTNGKSAGPVLNGPITLTDTLPAGISNIRINGSDWSIKRNGSVMTAIYAGSYPIDPDGNLASIIVKGSVIAAGGTVLLNTATVSTPGDSNAGNDTTSDSVAVCSPPVIAADLSIHLTHARTACTNIGDPITYTVVVTNGKAGSVVAGQPITVTVTLPNGLSNIAATGGTTWQLTTNGSMITANYSGNYLMKPGATLSPIMINATMQMPVSSSPIGSATVKTLRDSNLANNTAQDVLTICPPKLVVSKTRHVGGPLHVGQTVTYTIAVSNKPGAGPVVAGQSIKVIYTIAHSLKQIKATGVNWQFTITSSEVIATYAGQYPVIAGVHLPDIIIGGVMTTTTLPTISGSVAVKVVSGGGKVKKTALLTAPI